MLHQNPSEDEHKQSPRHVSRPEDEPHASWVFAALSLAILFGLWFFLFGNVRQAADGGRRALAPAASENKLRKTSFRQEPEATLATEKRKLADKGEEKALLLYFFKALDGR